MAESSQIDRLNRRDFHALKPIIRANRLRLQAAIVGLKGRPEANEMVAEDTPNGTVMVPRITALKSLLATFDRVPRELWKRCVSPRSGGRFMVKERQ